MPPAGMQPVLTFYNVIVRSKLLSPDEAKEAYRKWQEQVKAGLDDDAESLRKFLVARKYLTDYQSHLLLRGHSEGFFLGPYKILDLIGKGRMAGVFKAEHSSGQVVAIKVLPASKAKDPTTLGRFQREGRLLTKLDHPDVVRAFQVGEDGGRHYLVMEYLEGEPLDETLARRKRLPPAEAVRLVHQTLLGLQHVFEKGMVHRDLKPANLMLVPAPTPGPSETTLGSTVKLLDIGLGKSTFDELSKEPDPDAQLTTEGALLGTPDYLAPEQARSARDADIRSDIYSVGCILFHLLTGQVPFPDPNVLSQIVKHATEPPPPLAKFLPEVPEGLQQVLNWMMAKDPNQRYPTPARAAQALQMFLKHTPESAPARPLPEYEKYLTASGSFEGPKLPEPAAPAKAGPPAAEPKIPVGRLEPEARGTDRKKEAPPTKKAPAVPESDPPDDGEYDVEVVAVAPPAPPKKKREPGEPRGLLELDRRDYIMAAIGGGLVLTAILAGWGISRLLRGKPATTTPQEQPKDDQAPKEKKPPERRDTTDGSKKDDSTAKDESKPKDETKKPDANKDETAKDEVKKDGAKKDDAKKDGMKKDEGKKGEMKKDEGKKDDAKSKE